MTFVIRKQLLLISFSAAIFACTSSKDCADKSKNIYSSIRPGKSIKGKYCIVRVLSSQRSGKAIVMGHVMDRIGGGGLVAEVMIDKKTNVGEFADESGYFELEVEPGKYKIHVQHVGFNTLQTKEIEIDQNTIVEIDFYLGTSVVQ